MQLTPTLAATRIASAVYAAVQAESTAWLAAVRTLVAMLLALGIAFRLDLSSPSSAAVTVAVISLPQAGMVLEKSFYRLLATLLGGLITLIFVGVFAQQRDLFIVALALWVGGCAAASAWFRNFQSYGLALAGYTACLIGFPAFDHAEHAFDIVVDRVSIVTLGVLCGGVVNATLFPRSSAASLVLSVRGTFRDFVGFVQSTVNGYADRADLRATQLKFLQDIVALESARASSFFEDPEARVRTPRLRRFISQFMVASTTAHAINRLRVDFAAVGMGPVLTALEPLHIAFTRALHMPSGTPPTAAVEAQVIVVQLDALLTDWAAQADAARALLPHAASVPLCIELDSALMILREFIEEARDFAETYAELRAPHSRLRRAAGSAAVVRADPVLAMIAGLRTAIALIAMSTFWIVSGWNDGYAATLLAAVACTLFVNAPSPAAAVWQMVKGFVLGFAASIACFTWVLPALDGFILMAAGLSPFLLIGTYLMSRPSTMGLGSGYCLMFLVSLSITGSMQYDIVGLLNGGVAQIIGVAVAAIAFSVLFPANVAWHVRRIETTLWRELAIARHQPLPDLRHRFESGVRHMALQFINLATSDAQRRERVIASMIVLEAGRSVIQLRHLLSEPLLAEFRTEIVALLDALVHAFARAPSPSSSAALGAITHRVALLQMALQISLTAQAQPAQIELRTALQLLHLALRERCDQLAIRFDPAAKELSDAA